MQLSAQTIQQMCKDSELITPFRGKTLHKETNLSGGLTSAGYDVHINEFSIPTYQGMPISEFPLISAWDHRQKELDAHQKISTVLSLKLETLEKDVLKFENEKQTTRDSVYHTDGMETEEEFKERIKPLIEEADVICQNIDSQIILIQNEIKQLEKSLTDNSQSLNNLLKEKVEKQDIYVLQPNAIILGSTLERFKIPDNISMAYYNKSTLARRFIDSAATLGEPSWEGYLTLEIKNNSHVPITLYKGQPIGQVIFHKTDKPTDQPYDGKYQNQSSTPQGAI